MDNTLQIIRITIELYERAYSAYHFTINDNIYVNQVLYELRLNHGICEYLDVICANENKQWFDAYFQKHLLNAQVCETPMQVYLANKLKPKKARSIRDVAIAPRIQFLKQMEQDYLNQTN